MGLPIFRTGHLLMPIVMVEHASELNPLLFSQTQNIAPIHAGLIEPVLVPLVKLLEVGLFKPGGSVRGERANFTRLRMQRCAKECIV